MTFATYLRDVYAPDALARLAPHWRVRATRELDLLQASPLGAHELTGLTPAILSQWWGRLVARGRPVAANKQRQWLQQALRHAVLLELLARNPATHLKRVREAPPRVRWLDADQRKAILEEARRTNPRAFRYIWLAMHTLTRRNSLLKLEARDLNLKRQSVTYRRTKNGTDITAPLVPACLDEIQSWVAEGGPILFPYWAGAGISQAFRRICARCGISDITFHDLRHDLATRLVDAGVDLLVIKELGGWKTMGMVARYAHARESVKRDAMAKAFA